MAESPHVGGDSLVRLTIIIDGSELDESIKIVSVQVDKSINRIPVAKIVVLDGDMPNQDFPVSNRYFRPGAEITINAGYDQDEDTIFKGIVVKHGIKISGDNYSRLVVECRDKTVAMTVGRNNANFVDSKDSDIIAKLVGNYSGLSADVASTTTQHNELVQFDSTDWDFMLSRAEANGQVVIVSDAGVSVAQPDTRAQPKLKVGYGHDLIEFHADIDAKSQLTTVKSVSWDTANQAVVEAQSSPPNLNDQGDIKSSELAGVVGADNYRLQTSASYDQDVLKDWAKGQQIKAGLARIRGEMKFQGSAKARPGELIEVEGVGRHFNGNVYVSAVKQDIADGNWITTVEFGMSPRWFAENRDLTSPPASGLVPGVEGLHIGVVKKLDEDPKGQYKIQVSVPVMQASDEGVWARLANYYASEGFGAFFIPEIGDEVVLGYFNNDPSHPVVLGTLYSSRRKPPYDLTADNFIKALVTRSRLKLEFDDENKIITILTPNNNQLVINDKEKSVLIKDQNDNKVELNPAGIRMDSSKDIQINAKGKVGIDADGEINIRSNSDIGVEGMNIDQTANVGFTAKGSASAELSASGQTTVKGAMVMIN